MIKIDVDVSAVLRRVRAFENRSTATLMEVLGNLVEGQTKRRLSAEKTAPDGTPWKPLSPLTIAARRKGSNSPLTDSGALMGSIRHRSGVRTTEVFPTGEPAKYGAHHQYGVASIKPKKGRRLRVPLAGGGAAFIGESSIPARPFMGISAKNRVEIGKAVQAWAQREFGA